jgi:hypothetical protein
MLQFIDHRHGNPVSYLEKVTLYFQPQGGVVVQMGNQRFQAALEDVEKLLKNRLTHHAQYTEMLAQN